MILRPVLMPVPRGGELPRRERLPAQRAVSRRAVDESARLCGLTPRDWPLAANGAPAPVEGIHWSVSHKPSWTAGVVSDGPVGIDIEEIRPRRNELLFGKLATREEWDLVGGRTWDNFFRLWTANEAALKANGLGIGHLSECRVVAVRDETHLTVVFRTRQWTIEHYYHDDHVAAVTTAAEGTVWVAKKVSG